jgi:hypothetical protein
MCYLESPTRLAFTAARQACLQQGGDLVKYDSAAKQLSVEAYFASQGFLPSQYYWIGLAR